MRTLTSARRNAFTLVEMIVVIVIVLTVSGLVIAIAAPDNEGRRLRETARQITGMMQGARAKAIQTGRSVGVLIEPDALNALRATSLQNVEVAPPYGGDLSTSMALLEPISTTQAEVYLGSNLDRSAMPPRFTTPDAGWLNLVRINDLIRFNRQGHYYRIINVDTSATGNSNVPALQIQVINSALPPFAYYAVTTPEPGNWLPVPYEIIRQPETSAGTPLEIPDGVAIDLSASGIGKAGVFPGNPGPIVVLFSANGQAALWMPNDPSGTYLLTTIPSDSIFFLIGRNESLQGVAGPVDGNIAATDTYWVTVQHQTGLVISSENVPNTAGNVAAARGNSIQTQSAGTNN